MWRPEDGIQVFHPEERNGDWRELTQRYVEKIFFCSGYTDDGYLILHEREKQYRVKPDIYQTVPTPTFRYGDVLREKANSERTGQVYYIGWHFKHKREYYLLNINGKHSTKRVFSDDLEYVDSSTNI